MGAKAIAKREDVNPKEGVSQYGNVAFADEKNKKYPIDTVEHIRAAWNYINKENNAGQYDAGVTIIKKKIIAAWKDKIDPKGPPGAGGKSAVMPMADALLEAAMKAGARHSQSDQSHIQQAHDHLRDCGASCDAVNTDMEAQGKSLALKCMGMDAAGVMNYAQGEAMDIATAASSLQALGWLAQHEAGEEDEDPQDVNQLATVMRGLLDFISGEIDEMVKAPADDEAKSLDLDAMLVTYGGSAKSLADGHIGGYLVRFSDAKDPDLTGDFFTKDTDFGIQSGAKTPIYFNHTVPLMFGTRDGKKSFRVVKPIGEGTLTIDDMGVFVDAILFNREQYEKEILRTVKSNDESWSSGTVGHLIERKHVGKADWVKRWPLGLDASLTPTPADPNNAAVSLKSLYALPGQAAPDGAGAAGETNDHGTPIPDELLELGQMIQRKAGMWL